MIALAFILAVTLAGALVLVGVLVRSRLAASDREMEARVSQVGVQGELERARFELEVEKKALDSAHARAAALEEVIADDVKAAPNPDLDRGDIRSRVVRFSQRWAQADRDRQIPAVGAPPVPDASPAAAAGPPAVPAKPSGVP